jgi:AbrB family looped-hinge helix DNA binding protein
MVVAAKVTSKGQITLPKQVRKFLNVDTGSIVIFETEENKMLLKPAKTLSEFRGVLKGRAVHSDFDKIRAIAKEHVAKNVRSNER